MNLSFQELHMPTSAGMFSSIIWIWFKFNVYYKLNIKFEFLNSFEDSGNCIGSEQKEFISNSSALLAF